MRHIRSFNESIKYNVKSVVFDGFNIIYGKDSKSNDHVTLELSGDEDIFLHAKGVPGCHVLIKVKDKIPSKNVIEYAAKIAAKNSKSSTDLVNVVFCKKKFVTKESGMKDGQVRVDYLNSENILVSRK